MSEEARQVLGAVAAFIMPWIAAIMLVLWHSPGPLYDPDGDEER